MVKGWLCILLIGVWIGGAPEVGSQTAALRLHEMRFAVQGGQRIVSLLFSHPPDSLKSFVLASPLRLVVDVSGAVEQRPGATFDVDDALVRQVRVGFHPGYARFVLDLTGTDTPSFVVEQQESLVTAVLGEAGGESSQGTAPEQARVLFSLANTALAARATPQASSPPASRAPAPVLKDALPPASVPPEAQAHLERGQRLYDQGQVDEAIAEWQETIRLAPQAARAHHQLGVAWRDRGEQTKAIAAFRKALRLEPDNATTYVQLARALEVAGDTPGALEAYRAALRLVPSAPYVHNRLGHLLAAEGDWSGAAQAWQHTVDLVPDYAYAYVHLGDAFEHLNRKDEALSAYERALTLCGHFAEGLEKMGRKEQAAIFCREVRSSVVRLQGQ